MHPLRKSGRTRKEGSGYTIIVDESAIFLNKTAFLVYLLCNGKNSPEDIAKKVNMYFQINDYSQVHTEIEKILEDFRKYGLLEGFTAEEGLSKTFVPELPLYVTWCITKQCNLRCRHCYIDYEPREVTHSELLRILEKVKELHPFFVVLTGGEPLLREELFTIMEVLNKSEILLETNGTLINDRTADKIQEYSPEVQVSIYSTSEREHDAVTTVSGSFRKMMEGVSLLKMRGVPVQFNCVLHKGNIDDIQKITEFSLSHGEKIKFDILDLLGRAKNLSNLAFSESEYKKITEKVVDLQEEFPDQVCIHLPYIHLKDNTYNYNLSECTAGYSGFMIDFDGMVKPCEKLPLKVGSILQEDIADLWNCELMKGLRDLKNLKGRCAVCTFLEKCRGGCRGEAYLRTGDLFGQDPICWIEGG